jgi:hypothetical protein
MKRETRSRVGQTFAEGTFVDRAVKVAAMDALKRHRKARVPVIYYQDGKVVAVPTSTLARPARSGR